MRFSILDTVPPVSIRMMIQVIQRTLRVSSHNPYVEIALPARMMCKMSELN